MGHPVDLRSIIQHLKACKGALKVQSCDCVDLLSCSEKHLPSMVIELTPHIICMIYIHFLDHDFVYVIQFLEVLAFYM